ncbi:MULTISPECIES: transposase family protein [Rothia]|uniref:transposase family protein n=1 Tax=Rothia TaxID=32207 RepID=UPI00114CC475
MYLSPVVDLFNREIVAYVVSRRANSDMVGTMLHKACRQRNDAALRLRRTISYARV